MHVVGVVKFGSGSDARLTGTRFRHCKPSTQATFNSRWLSCLRCHLHADIATRFARLQLFLLCLVQLHEHTTQLDDDAPAQQFASAFTPISHNYPA